MPVKLTKTEVKSHPTAGMRALLNAVQGLMDICCSLQADGEMSDDVMIRKFCKRECERLHEKAAEFKSRAERHQSKLDGSSHEDNDDDEWGEDYKTPPEEKAIEVDHDGGIVIKAFPHWKPRRYTVDNIINILNDHKSSNNTSTLIQLDPNSPDYVSSAEAIEKKASEEEWEAAQKRLKKAQKSAQEVMEAARSNGLV